MTIHKEGYPTIAITVIFIALLHLTVKHFFSENEIIKILFYALSIFLLATVLQFFRHPKRNISLNDTAVIAPADGKVVVIEQTEEPEYFKDKRIQISIFMSPINVHVNRYPVGGKVKYAKYHKGKYLVAWHPKSSTENERTTIVVENKNQIPVLFRQIAGALARRIKYYCKEGDTAVQGSEFGFIKFGSRVDIFLPLNAKVNAKLNDITKGGETIIAYLQ